ncbi:MAG: SDR family NAD(P)-dependent oxidoreductase, partial [Candidatus Omnitrophica bacterium]|nr:SDR family NAD(P)-dependent oxidoreductase [Candidatus Omnitrophota bacterium]
MEQILRDRITVITGAARGLGEALSYGFAEEGAIVCPWDIDQENLDKVAGKLESMKRLGRKARVNITDEKQVSKELELIESEFGGVDIFIANAGILYSYEITEFPEDLWRKIIEINFTG